MQFGIVIKVDLYDTSSDLQFLIIGLLPNDRLLIRRTSGK